MRCRPELHMADRRNTDREIVKTQHETKPGYLPALSDGTVLAQNWPQTIVSGNAALAAGAPIAVSCTGCSAEIKPAFASIERAAT